MTAKLSLANKEYLTEFRRFICPHCKKTLFILPKSWNNHMTECFKELPLERLLNFREQSNDALTKDFIEKLMLNRHNKTIQ